MKLSYLLYWPAALLLGAVSPSLRAQTPIVTTLAATNITGTNATLNGTVNPSNSVTTYYFAYTTDTNVYSATIPNPSFEANSFTDFPGYAPGANAIVGWTASDYAGLNPSSGTPFANNGIIPDGTNVAFIQCNFTQSNTLSTTISGLIPGKTYQVTFRSNNREGYSTANGSVSLNGGSFVSFKTDPPVGGTNQYYTNSVVFTATGASAPLVVRNLTTNDSTVLVDAFTIASVPFDKFSTTNTLAATNIAVAVSNIVSGLQAATTYYFRIIASNSAGVSTGTTLSFTTGAGVPVATTLSASGIGATNATLNASVNPTLAATAAYFQYGVDTNYGFFSATNNLAATNAVLSVSNVVGGLSIGTTYHFRVVASNSFGVVPGADQTFTTIALPIVTTLPATGIGGTNATFNGSVNPGNGVTAVYFQYGADTNYLPGAIPNPSFELNTFTTFPGYISGNTAITGWTTSNTGRTGQNPAGGNPFADNGAVPSGANVAFIQSNNETNTLSTTITNLTAGKLYQLTFRANCRGGYALPNASVSFDGTNFVSFTAGPAVGGTNAYYTNAFIFTATSTNVPLILRNGTSGDSTVLLDAFSISQFPPRFTTTTNILSATNIAVAVSNLVSTLQPASTYFFQIIASNSAGTVFGNNVTLTTDVTAPIVTTLSAAGIATNQAMLTGSVNPNGLATVAYFRYGTNTSYGSFTATNDLVGTNIAFAVTNSIGALLPGTLYHFQLVASNSSGATFGNDQTFTTVRLPITASITSSADTGPGTLRQAILDSVPGDTILFDASLSGASLVLTNGQFYLANNMSIDASALTNGLRIVGNGGSRLFQVESNAVVTLTALTLNNGAGVWNGAGIYNAGNLTLERCTFSGNSATGGQGGTGSNGATSGANGGNGGIGGTGAGGAVYNDGTLTVNQCTFSGNLAKGGQGGTGGNGAGSFGNGGNGGNGGTGGTGAGGAIYNAGTATINQSTVAANTCTGGNGGFGGSGGGGTFGSNGHAGSTGSAGTGTGGGIYNLGTLTVFNSIVATDSPDNIVGPATYTGNNLTNGSPGLSSLGNNGGPTPTIILVNGSPAFETGASTPFTIDQRGFPRPMGMAPDIGAIEMTAPTVFTVSASSVTNTSATINGLVNPNGLSGGSYYFQYGTTTSYGSTTAADSLPTTNVAQAVAASISNLSPTTTYHYRVVASANLGLTVGSDMIFTTTTGVPVVTTTAASGINSASATLNGAVNPSGLPTAVYFEYGTDTDYGAFSATNAVSSTNVVVSVAAVATNLSPGVLYHFRAVAVNSGGTATGSDSTFVTLAQSPVATTLAATGVTSSTATLNSVINPGNGVTAVYFQYGRTTNFSFSNPAIPNPSFESNNFSAFPGYISANGNIIGWTASNPARTGLNPANGNPFADNGTRPDGPNVAFLQSNTNEINTLSTTITNLGAGRTYTVNFRANCRSGYPTPNSTWSLNGGSFVGFNSGPAVGGGNSYYFNSGSFTATSNTASLVLRNNTQSDTTAVVDNFSIFEDPTSGGFSATNNLGPTTNDLPVSRTINGLQPATTYYFRVVAANNGGSTVGSVFSFTTAAAAPVVTTLPATSITTNSATLNGNVNPQGSATAYYFQYGVTPSFGNFSPTNSLIATNVALGVSNNIAGLTPATPYYFRVVASNSLGTIFGANQFFVTPSAAPTVFALNSTILGTNAASGLVSVTLSATVNPNGSQTTGYFEYGRNIPYAATNTFATIVSNIPSAGVSTTISFSAGFAYHWRVVATNGIGSTVSPDQILDLGSLASTNIPGDLNGDGVVSQSELDAVYSNYVTNSPWLYMTNVAGLGETNVSFALQNSVSGAYTVQYSTNLTDWFTLGPASPRYLFNDTNASTAPQRYYRLVYP